MHEFLLYSQIPSHRHNQVLQILAGLTAAQPINFSEQQIIYQQTRSTQTPAARKGNTTQATRLTQLSYCKLVRDCTAEDEAGPWKIRKEEQPQAGLSDVISRNVVETTPTEADLERFKVGSEWYRQAAQVYITGCHFVQGNVVIRVVRAYGLKQPPTEDALSLPPLTSADLKALDASGAYLVEASIRAADESGVEIKDKAKKELLKFTEGLHSAISFYAPDRMALDSRVKGA